MTMLPWVEVVDGGPGGPGGTVLRCIPSEVSSSGLRVWAGLGGVMEAREVWTLAWLLSGASEGSCGLFGKDSSLFLVL